MLLYLACPWSWSVIVCVWCLNWRPLCTTCLLGFSTGASTIAGQGHAWKRCSHCAAAAVLICISGDMIWSLGKRLSHWMQMRRRSQEACSMDCSWTRETLASSSNLCLRARQWSWSSTLESSVRFGFWQMVLGAFLWLWLAGEVQSSEGVKFYLYLCFISSSISGRNKGLFYWASLSWFLSSRRPGGKCMWTL